MCFHPELLAEAHRRASEYDTDRAFVVVFHDLIREWHRKGWPTLIEC